MIVGLASYGCVVMGHMWLITRTNTPIRGHMSNIWCSNHIVTMCVQEKSTYVSRRSSSHQRIVRATIGSVGLVSIHRIPRIGSMWI